MIFHDLFNDSLIDGQMEKKRFLRQGIKLCKWGITYDSGNILIGLCVNFSPSIPT